MTDWIMSFLPWAIILAFWVVVLSRPGLLRPIRIEASDGTTYFVDGKGVSHRRAGVTLLLEWNGILDATDRGSHLQIRAAESELKVPIPAKDRDRRALGRLVAKKLGARAHLTPMLKRPPR